MRNNGLAKTNGNLLPAIPSLLEDVLSRNWLDTTTNRWGMSGSTFPAANIRENSDDFMIEVAVPGLKRKDFTVELDRNVLTVSVTREDGQENGRKGHGDYTRREFSYHSFRRSFVLPEKGVSSDGITAKYVDGILQISIPRTEDAKTKPAKQIAVS